MLYLNSLVYVIDSKIMDIMKTDNVTLNEIINNPKLISKLTNLVLIELNGRINPKTLKMIIDMDLNGI